MKTSLAAQIAFTLLLMLPSLALAHGGGLDGYGGHNNRKLGGYHFHRGPLAGNHYASKSEALDALSSGGGNKASVATMPPPPKSETRTGAANSAQLIGVASVIDGDTIEIHGQRIRLHGIDAPESSQICTRDGRPWKCGQEAANKLAEKIGKQTVTCASKDKDKYGRIVAVCSASATDLNGWLVSEGAAVAYRKYSQDYIGQETTAKGSRKGIWDSEFEMPWDWRRTKKQPIR